jgi:uncharacterized Tic20 family protein
MTSERETIRFVRGYFSEVNWRPHLTFISILMFLLLLLSIAWAAFHARFTKMTAWEIAAQDGPLIFNCSWIFILSLVATIRCFKKVSDAEWMFGRKFGFFDQYKLKRVSDYESK